jgi:cytochrome c
MEIVLKKIRFIDMELCHGATDQYEFTWRDEAKDKVVETFVDEIPRVFKATKNDEWEKESGLPPMYTITEFLRFN